MRIDHEFVDTVPDTLQGNLLYVSLKYNTAIHKCFCGCGEEVVTPLSPLHWKMTYDGESISLYPSIGNWSLECHSHYWVTGGQVIWAEKWTDEEVRTIRNVRRKEAEPDLVTEEQQQQRHKFGANPLAAFTRLLKRMINR